MTTTIKLFGLAFEPTFLQRRVAGRLACVLVAGPLTLLALLPLFLQAAKM